MITDFVNSINSFLVQITTRAAQTIDDGEELVGESVGDPTPFLDFAIKAGIFILAAVFVIMGLKYQHKNNSIITVVGKIVLIAVGGYMFYELFMSDTWGLFPKE
ncbi:MAG: hypothetical protein LBL93_01195 [Ruminococcus sp.]|jgi:hypothetical protein|nr:hypothetical protein [Ruminococcus sp.]